MSCRSFAEVCGVGREVFNAVVSEVAVEMPDAVEWVMPVMPDVDQAVSGVVTFGNDDANEAFGVKGACALSCFDTTG